MSSRLEISWEQEAGQRGEARLEAGELCERARLGSRLRTSSSSHSSPGLSRRAHANSRSLPCAVEFYLSDSNLPFDKFLFTLWSNSFHTPSPVVLAAPIPADLPTSALSASAQSKMNPFHLGWLPLSRLTSFKRMQPFLEPAPAGFGSADAIASVVAASSTLVEVRQFGDDGTADAGWFVRRKTELSRPEDVLDRSVYVKGFPVREGEAETEEAKKEAKLAEDELQKKLEAWGRELGVGKFKSLRMRREDLPVPAGAKGIPKKGRGKFKVSLRSRERGGDGELTSRAGIRLHRVPLRRVCRQVPRSRPQAYLRRQGARDHVQVSRTLRCGLLAMLR